MAKQRNNTLVFADIRNRANRVNQHKKKLAEATAAATTTTATTASDKAVTPANTETPVDSAPVSAGLLILPIEKLDVEPQIRTHFDEETIQELADSIKEYGQISPVTVRANGDRFTLITGERRWRAIKRLGLPSIKAILDENAKTNTDITVSQLIENLQREDMTLLDIGLAYCQLMQNQGWSVDQVAKKTGKNRRWVYRVTSVGNLPKLVQQWIGDGHLSDIVAIENLAKLYKATETPEDLTNRLAQVVAKNLPITRAVVEGLLVPPQEKPVKPIPLNDVPLTVANASNLKKVKGYENYDFPGLNFKMECEFVHPDVNSGQPTQGAQVIPSMVYQDRSQAVVEYQGKVYLVPWSQVKITQTVIPGKSSHKAKKS